MAAAPEFDPFDDRKYASPREIGAILVRPIIHPKYLTMKAYRIAKFNIDQFTEMFTSYGIIVYVFDFYKGKAKIVDHRVFGITDEEGMVVDYPSGEYLTWELFWESHRKEFPSPLKKKGALKIPPIKKLFIDLYTMMDAFRSFNYVWSKAFEDCRCTLWKAPRYRNAFEIFLSEVFNVISIKFQLVGFVYKGLSFYQIFFQHEWKDATDSTIVREATESDAEPTELIDDFTFYRYTFDF